MTIMIKQPTSSKLDDLCFSFQTPRIKSPKDVTADSSPELICSHEILKYVIAEPQRTSLILSQLERMKEGGEEKKGSESDERKPRETKGCE